MNMDAGGRFSIVVPALLLLGVSINADAIVTDVTTSQVRVQPAKATAMPVDPARAAVLTKPDSKRAASLQFAHAAANMAGPSNAILVVIGVMMTAALALWRRRRPRWVPPGQSPVLLLPSTSRRLTPVRRKPGIF